MLGRGIGWLLVLQNAICAVESHWGRRKWPRNHCSIVAKSLKLAGFLYCYDAVLLIIALIFIYLHPFWLFLCRTFECRDGREIYGLLKPLGLHFCWALAVRYNFSYRKLLILYSIEKSKVLIEYYWNVWNCPAVNYSCCFFNNRILRAKVPI